MRSVIQTLFHSIPGYLAMRRRPYIQAAESLRVKAFREWQEKGSPAPLPNLVKQHCLLQQSRNHGLDVLVETGTCRGKMLEATKHEFRDLYSVELSDHLFEFCQQKFEMDKHVHLHHGDSVTQLPAILAKLKRPALFWLDAHYSHGETGAETWTAQQSGNLRSCSPQTEIRI